jgi:hypothetical protein
VPFHVPDAHRVLVGQLRSTSQDGNNGAFDLSSPISGRRLAIIASDGGGWEHVSVHVYVGKGTSRAQLLTPTWDEMCFVKNQFWDDEDLVVQFHPPKSQYIDCHPHTLHLWKKIGSEFELPPPEFV